MSSFRAACFPAKGGPGQDRWAVFENCAFVLDGASSFTPAAVNAERFVDTLVADLSDALAKPAIPLRSALKQAIRSSSMLLDLTPGNSPSSTIILLRQSPSELELLVLGDSTAIIGTTDRKERRLTDDRLASIASDKRETYRSRLRAGYGYDSVHRQLLKELQEKQISARNTPGGYWIAEADPSAADKALSYTMPINDVKWCVLATDGAQRVIDHLGIPWSRIAAMTSEELANQLEELYRWESVEDPMGILLPRAKMHDDKTVVVFQP
ncbi:hypothetical protein GCM10012275_49000 [Longimycelium tulufanense]|uniref:PPM-type phosphatase domain-containing protein n=1 Tax=Longimycelium tulufanense TaxID=907463 RepID=A0A8J3CIK1_9PSEU|nr:protein phosphatase 2C domain-containing protein [Longimycelium tulufanense]GGM72605.1 hypothetical protein GCM10012275_49000 [Longimycelium tulufanense]